MLSTIAGIGNVAGLVAMLSIVVASYLERQRVSGEAAKALAMLLAARQSPASTQAIEGK